jgi:hypothetical protein
VTICPECKVRFRRFSADGEVFRTHCFRHQIDATAPDSRAVARLRRTWGSQQPSGVAIARPAMTEDDRAEALRRRAESSEPWRTDVPLYENEQASENALLLTLDPHELAAQAA